MVVEDATRFRRRTLHRLAKQNAKHNWVAVSRPTSQRRKEKGGWVVAEGMMPVARVASRGRKRKLAAGRAAKRGDNTIPLTVVSMLGTTRAAGGRTQVARR